MARREWPEWWDWELELSPHFRKRMVDRRITEVDLRRMLEDAQDVRPDVAHRAAGSLNRDFVAVIGRSSWSRTPRPSFSSSSPLIPSTADP